MSWLIGTTTNSWQQVFIAVTHTGIINPILSSPSPSPERAMNMRTDGFPAQATWESVFKIGRHVFPGSEIGLCACSMPTKCSTSIYKGIYRRRYWRVCPVSRTLPYSSVTWQSKLEQLRIQTHPRTAEQAPIWEHWSKCGNTIPCSATGEIWRFCAICKTHCHIFKAWHGREWIRVYL